MKKSLTKKIAVYTLVMSLAAFSMAGCSGNSSSASDGSSVVKTSSGGEVSYTNNTDYTSLLDISDLFSNRDLKQEADTSEAQNIALESGSDITISQEGVYVLSGSVENCTIIVNTDKESKVQLVLDGVSITNDNSPAIVVVSADKCFVTTTDSENTFKVTGSFTETEGLDTDAVIYSKDDLVLNGKGTLNIESTDNAVTAKDDLKITGGVYNFTCTGKGFQANDSILINDGTFNIKTNNDAFHSENNDDDKLGYIYIAGGSFELNAEDDALQSHSAIQIDGGEFSITAHEAIEATTLQINGGKFTISASDDAINATQTSTAYSTAVEINGGEITMTIGQGDTDAIDSNGDIVVNGGYIDITANSAFDYDGTASYNGGTIIINGEQVNEIPQPQQMGGKGRTDK